jgi:hypothetical protein
MAAVLVTLIQAKEHLGIPSDDLADTDRDADIQLKLDQAEGYVLDRCGSTAWWRAITTTWTAVTVPPAVTAAILFVVGHLREHRGDDPPDDAFWAVVDRLIGLHKDPVLA